MNIFVNTTAAVQIMAKPAPRRLLAKVISLLHRQSGRGGHES